MGVSKKYFSLLIMSMQQAFAYRFNFLINALSGIIFVTSLYYVWKAIFGERDELNGLTWEGMQSYLLVVFISNMLLSWYTESGIARRVLDGSVSMDLLKPLDFQKARLFETLGNSIVEGGMSVLFAVIWAFLFTGAQLPPDAASGLFFLASLILSVFIKFNIIYLAGLVCFYTTSHLGVLWARTAITNLFSGALVPLALFPDWLGTMARLLPFQGIIAIPAAFYMGQLDGAAALEAIGIQLFWVVVLWFAGKAFWRWSVRQVTIHGG